MHSKIWANVVQIHVCLVQIFARMAGTINHLVMNKGVIGGFCGVRSLPRPWNDICWGTGKDFQGFKDMVKQRLIVREDTVERTRLGPLQNSQYLLC
jgi:hypothetical protein